MQLGDSVIMLSDESPEIGNRSPGSVGGTPVTLSIYVEDVDDVFSRGHRWSIATHVEDVSTEEMGRRAAEAVGGGAAG